MKKIFSLLFACCLCYFLFTAEVFASDNETALELQTPIVFETINQGETRIVQVTLANHGNSELLVSPNIKSIDSVSNLGQIGISQEKPIWQDWIKFNDSIFIIRSKEVRSFSFALDVPQSADSGSYSGIIAFCAKNNGDSLGSESQVNQSAGLGLVLLLNVIGNEGLSHVGEVETWGHFGSIGGLHTFNLQYRNSGSSIFVPIGLITIWDWRGNLVDFNVLEDHWILPGKEYNYVLKWAPKNSFGLYHARIEIQNVFGSEFKEIAFFSFTGSGVKWFVLCIFMILVTLTILFRIIIRNLRIFA